MPDRLPDGSTYQTAWEAFTGLFDKRRHGKPPTLVNGQPEEDEDEDAKKKPADG